MKRVLHVALTLALLLNVCWAFEEGGGPTRPSLVGFPHKLHQTALGGCTDCHGAKNPGKIAGFGEQWAHNTCMGCHRDVKDSGPVECMGCHQY